MPCCGGRRASTQTAATELAPPRQFGDLTIDAARHEVNAHGQPLTLIARDFALLVALAAQPGRVFTRAHLEQVWGTEFYDDHVVDVHVANLRHKLEAGPCPSALRRDRPRCRVSLWDS